MLITLAYGKTGLQVHLPDEWNLTVIAPRFVSALLDPATAVRDALRAPMGSAPLRALVQPTSRVSIVFSDITRPTPNRVLLPAVLDELRHIPPERITLFNALGTHRANTDAELRGMLGDALVDTYRIVQNNAFDPTTQVCLGTSSRGHSLWVNRALVECDVKILTGFIEPHLFAGFSGGGKAIMPGMAGLETVLGNHDTCMIGHPAATWGRTWGNPIWEEIREVALKIGSTLLLNVTLNRDKAITGVFAGDLDVAHTAGCAFAKESAMVTVPELFDIVVTTNSGYPLDLNLYQSVKGMSAAAQIVRQGGAIVIATECCEGIPEHGLYGQILGQTSSPQEVLARIATPGLLEHDQWQVQIQAQIQLRADVHVYSEHLTREQLASALLVKSDSVEATLAELMRRYGVQARLCVLPEGPQTIPYIA